MTRTLCRLAGGLLLAMPLCAFAQVDLSRLDDQMTGPKTRFLVLGTVHLSEQKDFKASSLAPLLDKLAAYQPQVITIEAISGEQCDLAARHASVYGKDYCRGTEEARAATGLDVPAAIAQVKTTLASWPKQPSAAERRRLASLFLAANDRSSAFVQWLRLSAQDRHAGDGLDDALVKMLREIETHPNENYQIAARLAARLGLERVYAVDDHTGDNHQITDTKAFGEEVMAAWKSDRARAEPLLTRQDALAQEPDLLPLYRLINQPDSAQLAAEFNVLPTLRAQSATHYPQIWVNGWEIRNLRMVANVLETVRDQPGQRVLSIVGASHKPWFDTWLAQTPGAEIVDVEEVLR